jgi:hypothetical protein
MELLRMIYLKAFEAILPLKVKNHLDVGTGERFRFDKLVSSEKLLCNEVSLTKYKSNLPCFIGNALLLSDFLKEKYFDLITCFDMIEHLKKDEGYELIQNLEKLSNDIIVFFTPLGEIAINQSKIQFETHLSGWLPIDFINLGYKCWVFPKFHKKFGYGAFFAIKSKNIVQKKSLKNIDEIFEGEHWIENKLL